MIIRNIKHIVGTAVLAVSLFFAAPAAQAQGTMQQVTPVVPGHTVTGVQNGQFMDGGAAQGGPINVGLSELLQQTRTNGQAPSAANGFLQGPFQGNGTGPFGTHTCEYAGSPKSPAGSYYLCSDADALANGVGGGLIAYGSIGTAPLLPFQFCVNDSCLQFPFTGAGGGNVVGVPPTTIGGATCFDNTIATLIEACNPSQAGGPAIAAVLPTVVDAPVCWDNVTGTLLITCPGSGAAGDFEVNTTNGSGTPSFTPFLTLPQNPSLSTSPTGNPTGGSLLPTFSTIVAQAATANANNREFMVNIGLTSSLGAGIANSNGDKVGLYVGAVGLSGTGDLWGINPLLTQSGGSGSYNAQVGEFDLNNFNASKGGVDGPMGLPAKIANGISISGTSDSNGYLNTADLALDSFGGPGANIPLFAHAITVSGFYEFNEYVDYAQSPTAMAFYGGHAYGLDFFGGFLTSGAIRLESAAAGGIIGRNTANTGDVQLLTWNGADEFICQTGCALVSSLAQIQAPNFTASIGMTINSLPVPTGVGVTGLCPVWQTATNLSAITCNNGTADGITIVNNAGVFSAVAGPSVFTVPASSSSTTITPGTNSQANVALTSSTTITMGSGFTDGDKLMLRLAQDGTGGRTVAFDSTVVFGTSITGFTASTGANKTDLVGLQWDATKGKWLFLAFALGF